MTPRKHYEPWTRAESRRVQQLNKEGLDIARIAKEVGRSEHAVISALSYPRRGDSFVAPAKPKHVTAQHQTDDWWAQNNAAFVKAMLKHHADKEVRLDGDASDCFEGLTFTPKRINGEVGFGASCMADMAE